jgi:hypothetical protein
MTLMLVMGALMFVNCGGGGGGSSSSSSGSSSQSAQTGTVTVKAESGGLIHSMQVAITVN